MHTLLTRSMMDRERFGDMVTKTMSTLHTGMLRDVASIEEIMDLAEIPFQRHLSQAGTPSSSPTWTPSTSTKEKAEEVEGPLVVSG